MDGSINYFYVILALFMAGYTIYLITTVWQSQLYKKGILGNKLVSGVLERFAKLRNYKVLNDVNLQVGNEKIHADHILVGFFGLLVVDDVQNMGDYFGDDRDGQWVYIDVITNKKIYIPNPVKENNKTVEKIRKMLGNESIYKMKIENYAVFTGKEKKTGLYAKESIGAVRFKEFKKIIKHSKFTEDNDVDVEKICEVFEKYSAK